MIDFRYHLVSLISVFLALAVGIVLGAGPLKESIGDTLTGEVDTLRQRAADLRAELDSVSAELARTEDAWATVAPDLLAGTMEGRRVAVVEVGEPRAAVVDEVVTRLTQTGATVTGRVRLQDVWTDPTRATFRQTVAGSLLDYLDPVPPSGSSALGDLAEALVQGLGTAAPEDPDAIGEDAAVLLQVLVDSELVEIADPVTVPADGIVVVTGPVDGILVTEDGATPEPEELDRLELVLDSVRELALAGVTRTRGAVVAGHEVVPEGVLARLREASGTTSRVTTVSRVDTLVGQVSTALALAQRMGGAVGHYGPEGDATALVPRRVVLPPLVRTPQVADEEGEGTEGTDAEGTEGEAAQGEEPAG